MYYQKHNIIRLISKINTIKVFLQIRLHDDFVTRTHFYASLSIGPSARHFYVLPYDSLYKQWLGWWYQTPWPSCDITVIPLLNMFTVLFFRNLVCVTAIHIPYIYIRTFYFALFWLYCSQCFCDALTNIVTKCALWQAYDCLNSSKVIPETMGSITVTS